MVINCKRPCKRKRTTMLTVEQMVDIALGTPEIGAVNFNVLHALIHVIIQRLNIQKCLVEFKGYDSDRMEGIILTAKPGPILKLSEYMVDGTDGKEKGTKEGEESKEEGKEGKEDAEGKEGKEGKEGAGKKVVCECMGKRKKTVDDEKSSEKGEKGTESETEDKKQSKKKGIKISGQEECEEVEEPQPKKVREVKKACPCRVAKDQEGVAADETLKRIPSAYYDSDGEPPCQTIVRVEPVAERCDSWRSRPALAHESMIRLEEKVAMLQDAFEALEQMPTNEELKKRAQTPGHGSTPVKDLWQLYNLNKRVEGCEGTIEKLASMIEDLVKETCNFREAMIVVAGAVDDIQCGENAVLNCGAILQGQSLGLTSGLASCIGAGAGGAAGTGAGTAAGAAAGAGAGAGTGAGAGKGAGAGGSGGTAAGAGPSAGTTGSGPTTGKKGHKNRESQLLFKDCDGKPCEESQEYEKPTRAGRLSRAAISPSDPAAPRSTVALQESTSLKQIDQTTAQSNQDLPAPQSPLSSQPSHHQTQHHMSLKPSPSGRASMAPRVSITARHSMPSRPGSGTRPSMAPRASTAGRPSMANLDPDRRSPSAGALRSSPSTPERVIFADSQMEISPRAGVHGPEFPPRPIHSTPSVTAKPATEGGVGPEFFKMSVNEKFCVLKELVDCMGTQVKQLSDSFPVKQITTKLCVVAGMQKQLDGLEKEWRNFLSHYESSGLGGIDGFVLEFTTMKSNVENLTNTVAKMKTEKLDSDSAIKVLAQETSYLKKVKADIEVVEDLLAEKADTALVNRKVSHDQFDAACDDLTRGLDEALEKLLQQEVMWHEAMEEVQNTLENKLDKIEIMPLKEFINKKLTCLQEKLRQLAQLRKVAEAAGAKSRILRNLNCIACDGDVVMKMDNRSGYPTNPMPPSKSIRPLLTYELDQVRKAMKKSIACRASSHVEEVLMDAQKKEAGIPLIKEDAIRNKAAKFAHYCNRYCGGSHTITTAHQRVTRIGHFLTEFGPQAIALFNQEFLESKSGHQATVSSEAGIQEGDLRKPC